MVTWVGLSPLSAKVARDMEFMFAPGNLPSRQIPDRPATMVHCGICARFTAYVTDKTQGVCKRPHEPPAGVMANSKCPHFKDR